MRRYRAFLRQQLHALTIYRFEFFIKILYGCIAMFGVRCLWVTLYSQDPSLLERSLPSMITYAMLAMAMDMIFYPSGDNAVYSYMNNQVKKGAIDTDLLRPMGFQRQMLYRNSSRMIALCLVLVLPACAIAMGLMGMQLPVSLCHGLLFLLSMVAAYFVLFSMGFLLGLLGMITMDIKHISWVFRGLEDLFSGKLIPLWIFPGMLQKAANKLPFRCVYDIPLNIYTGAFSNREIAEQLAFQILWAVLLFGLGQLLWRRIHKRLTVQGG